MTFSIGCTECDQNVMGLWLLHNTPLDLESIEFRLCHIYYPYKENSFRIITYMHYHLMVQY